MPLAGCQGIRDGRPPQHGSQPGQQFACREGLRQIIVRAHLEPHDAIGLLTAPGQHEDRNVGVYPEPAQDLEPVHARQHDVQNQGVKRLLQSQFKAGGPVCASATE